MNGSYEFRYDRQANALYIRVRQGKSARQREHSQDIILDVDDYGNLLGIEVLHPDADLAPFVGELGLDPHILDVVGKIRQLIPETHKQLDLT